MFKKSTVLTHLPKTKTHIFFLILGQDSSSATSNSSASSASNDQSPQSVGETSKGSETTRGSFRLFRSNSWSSRRKKTSEFSEIPVETTQIQNSSNENDVIDDPNRQRSSPSYSTKSQDSGCFSENGINGLTSNTNSTAQLIQNQRLQFLRSNMELREDEQDPNLTQANSANNSADFPPKKPNVNTNSSDSSSKTKLTESLGNIASLQTGLNIKRQMAEGDLTQPLPAPPTGTLANLLRPQRPQHDKIRPKSFQDSVNDLSQLSQDFLAGNGDTPVFSTPVRASFRGGKLRPRPHTVIHLEDARTPSKREAKTRLRELKTKASRHFSGDIIADPDQDVPNGIEPSLVAVWNQFVNYEPSIPALSSVVTPSIK